MLNNQKLQGFLAITPLVTFFLLIIGYFLLFISLFSLGEVHDGNAPTFSPTSFIGGMTFFMVMIFLTIFISLFSFIYFIIHAAKNPNLDSENNMRVVWILIIALVGYVGSFIYWLIEIKNKNPKPFIPN